jgi:hypothetical protein
MAELTPLDRSCGHATKAAAHTAKPFSQYWSLLSLKSKTGQRLNSHTPCPCTATTPQEYRNPRPCKFSTQPLNRDGQITTTKRRSPVSRRDPGSTGRPGTKPALVQPTHVSTVHISTSEASATAANISQRRHVRQRNRSLPRRQRVQLHPTQPSQEKTPPHLQQHNEPTFPRFTCNSLSHRTHHPSFHI